MKENLENRENDWLADEIKREQQPQQLDLDESRKLKEEHLRLHKKAIVKFPLEKETLLSDLLITVLLLVVVIMCLSTLIQSVNNLSNPAYSAPWELLLVQAIPSIIFVTLFVLQIMKLVKEK